MKNKPKPNSAKAKPQQRGFEKGWIWICGAVCAVVLISVVSLLALRVPTVATVNGTRINARDVSFRITQAEFEIERLGHAPADFDRAVREEAVRLAALHVFYSEHAERLGVSLTREDVALIEREIDEMAMEFESAAEFNAMLNQEGIQNRRHLEAIFYSFDVMNNVLSTIVSDPAEFARFAHYMEEEEILAATHILAYFNNFDTEADARAYAEALLARALAGEDFNMLAQEYGQDPGLGPEGYTFVSGVMMHEFEDGTRALEIGEISGLVRTSFGYHIIKRIPPDLDNVTRPWGINPEDRMAEDVHRGFEAMVAAADIEFRRALDNVNVS